MSPLKPIKLTSEDKKRLEDLEPDITSVQEEILRAERAGLDVSGLKADLERAIKLREGVLREYG